MCPDLTLGPFTCKLGPLCVSFGPLGQAAVTTAQGTGHRLEMGRVPDSIGSVTKGYFQAFSSCRAQKNPGFPRAPAGEGGPLGEAAGSTGPAGPSRSGGAGAPGRGWVAPPGGRCVVALGREPGHEAPLNGTLYPLPCSLHFLPKARLLKEGAP